MCSVSKVLAVLAFLPLPPLASRAADLRVCADSNNLPYSDSAGAGYEIELAQLTGKELGRPVQFVWITQRGEYLRKTLFARKCDVLMSIPTSLEAVLTTRPYYRSTYVFVSRRDRHLDVRSFDDPRLKTLRIGVQILQNEAGSTTPAAQPLIDRQLSGNIVWYKIYSNFSRRNPAADLIEGVEHGDIDLAVAWGPLAGLLCAERARCSQDRTRITATGQVDSTGVRYLDGRAPGRYTTLLRPELGDKPPEGRHRTAAGKVWRPGYDRIS